MTKLLFNAAATLSFVFGVQVNCAATEAVTAESVAGVYESTRAPGFPFPGTDTVTLSKDGSFRLDLALSRGKIATFLGTWTYSDRMVFVVTTERLLDGKPNPPTNPSGWKPGHEMNMPIKGNKLFRSETSDEPFTKVSE